jgi:hypothetical protein
MQKLIEYNAVRPFSLQASGSLDTIDNPFGEFKKHFQELFPNFPVPSDTFLWWLVGFSEGDSCWFVSKTGLQSFRIIQGVQNSKILYKIKYKES